MSEREFLESQEECAAMLGMTLSEYQNYCNNLEVPTDDINTDDNTKDTYDTYDILKDFGLDSSILKQRIILINILDHYHLENT